MAATAATGLDALTHVLEVLPVGAADPVSTGIALQVTRMIAAHLPGAYADGQDLEARSQMLLAAHNGRHRHDHHGTGVVRHAIGHALGGRFDVAHGVALTMVLPHVLRFNAAVREERLAQVAAALGAADTARSAAWNAAAAIDAIETLAGRVGMTSRLADLGPRRATSTRSLPTPSTTRCWPGNPRPPTPGDILAPAPGGSPLARRGDPVPGHNPRYGDDKAGSCDDPPRLAVTDSTRRPVMIQGTRARARSARPAGPP